MFEYEKKVMLMGDEYTALIMMMCKYAPVVTQTNYYFDTDDFSMNKKGVTCRIRARNGMFKATVKSHCTDKDNCSTEEDICVKREFDPDIFNSMGLHYQGKLVTERIVIYKDSYCEMVLDRNTYLGMTDFELEIEYVDGYEGKALKLLEYTAESLVASRKISNTNKFLIRVGKSKSKSERFFERKMQGR